MKTNQNLNKNFYVYIVTHKETGQFYIGSRSCYCLPTDVRYISGELNKENKIYKQFKNQNNEILL